MNSKKQNDGRFSIHFFGAYLLTAFCFLIFMKDATPQDMSQDDLQKIINEYVSDKKGVLGIIVQIDFPDKEPLKAIHGHFDLTRKRPIGSQDKFLIGSITKTFTATLVLQLVEAGLVDLDGRLIDYLPPDWAAALSQARYGEDITVEHALCHRSGVFNVLARETFLEFVLPDPSRKWPPSKIIKMIPEMGEPHFKPGESFKYSNTNYLLLSGLIEHVTKKSYINSLQDNILSRIGLENTFHSKGPFGSNREDVIHGYQKIDGKLYDGQAFDSSWAMGAGAMISTTDDLIKYMKALKSGRLFKHNKTFQKMIQSKGENSIYSLGIEASKESQFGPYYGHRGTFMNSSSALRHFPEHGITICTCLTFDGTAKRLITDELLQVVMGKLLGIEYIPRIPQHQWPQDIFDYKKLDFRISGIKTVEQYDCQRKTIKAKSKHNKLILVTLKGKTPRNGRFQYSPSRVTLQYKAGDKTLTTPCLAIGRIYSNSELWVTHDEEFKRISRSTMDKNEKITIHALFELPKECEVMEALFF